MAEADWSRIRNLRGLEGPWQRLEQGFGGFGRPMAEAGAG